MGTRPVISVLTANPRLVSANFLAELEALAEVRNHPDSAGKPPEDVAAVLSGSDIALTGWGSPLLPSPRPGWRLRYICHMTGEMKRVIPLEYIRAGIKVTNWGESMAFATAEGALALLLCVLRRIPELDMKARTSARPEFTPNPVQSLYGACVGIYGLSSVGLRTAELLRPFRPVLSFYDPTITEPPPDIRRCGSLKELFAENEIITIHAGLNEATRHSVTEAELMLMKPGGILVNTARGAIVREGDLAAVLARKRIHAAIDVIEDESDWRQSPLMGAPNVIFSGHRISRTGRTGVRVRQETALMNIRAFLEGRPLRYEITPERYSLMT